MYNKITEDSIKLRMIEQATEFVLSDKILGTGSSKSDSNMFNVYGNDFYYIWIVK